MEDIKYNWKGKTILIVEDEADNSELLYAIMEDTQANLLQAYNGVEALGFFNSGQHIDLVLMDIKMPEMNGLEATMEIRKKHKDVPIIAQTAYALSGDKENALQAGCTSYIAKPIDGEKLLIMIDGFVGR
jgi:two-component system, cell cycle response regulator DivK